jgi:hypothetical protein
VARKRELVLVALSRTSCAAISLFASDMGKECSRWVDVCRMLDRGDLWHSTSAVTNLKRHVQLGFGERTADSGSVSTYPGCILSPARRR